MIGLALALVALLIEMAAVGTAVDGGLETGGGWTGLAIFMLAAALPLALGLYMAHAGDPGIGSRFAHDAATSVSQLRRPETLTAALRTSMGLGLAIAIVSVPLILLTRQASILVGLAGLTMFSIVDPLLNTRRTSWWPGAILSAGTWLALLVVLAATANAIEPMREGGIVFMLPMMIFAGATVLSGIARLWLWTAGRAQ